MKIATLFSIGVIGNVLVSVAIFALSESHTLVGVEHLVSLMMLSLVLILLLTLPDHDAFPLVLVLGTYVFLKYCLSVPFLLLLPEYGSDWLITKYSGFTQDQFYRSFYFATLATICAGLALVIGFQLMGAGPPVDAYTNAEHAHRRLVEPRAIFLYVLVLLSIHVYVNPLTGIDVDEESEWNWLRIFLRQTVIRSLLIAMIIFHWRSLTTNDKVLIAVTLLLTLAYSIVEGTRSGVYIYTMMLLFVGAVRFGNFPFPKQYVKYLVIAVLMAIAIYPVATALRMSARYHVDVGRLSKEVFLDAFESRFPGATSVVSEVAGEALHRFTEPSVSIRIMNDMQVTPIGDMLSVSTIFKRIANNLVPGDLFSGVVPAQHVFDQVYEGAFFGFNAQEWGIWEYLYAMSTGYWGALFCLSAILIFIGACWRLLLRSRLASRDALLVTFLYFYWQLLLNYDFGYVLSSAMIEVLVLFFAIYVLRLIDLGMGQVTAFMRRAVRHVPV